jgi:PAS domain-containing protein
MEQLTEFETLEREKITDLQQSYNELEKLYLARESIIQNSTDAIQISDQDLVTIRVNKAYRILTGIKGRN